MLATPFETGCQTQKLVFTHSRKGQYRSQAGFPLREGAGLIDDQRIDLFQHFQCFRVLHQHARQRPRPLPTIIDIGVASPNAHGQAIMSATALTSA